MKKGDQRISSVLRLEGWNERTKRYDLFCWVGQDLERALIQMKKPYYPRLRRLVRVVETTEVLQKEKS